jgi:hypothetical protein
MASRARRRSPAEKAPVKLRKNISNRIVAVEKIKRMLSPGGAFVGRACPGLCMGGTNDAYIRANGEVSVAKFAPFAVTWRSDLEDLTLGERKSILGSICRSL